MHTIKPLDSTTLLAEAAAVRLVVTVEEHSEIGGLGSAVAESLSVLQGHAPIVRIGVPDRFPKVGSYEYVLEQCGLAADTIADRILIAFAELGGARATHQPESADAIR